VNLAEFNLDLLNFISEFDHETLLRKGLESGNYETRCVISWLLWQVNELLEWLITMEE